MNGFEEIFFADRGDAGEEAPEFPDPPVWSGPPDDELGVFVPLSVVLGRSDRAVVVLEYVKAYSTGLAFKFLMATRGLGTRDAQRLLHERHLVDEDNPADTFLRIGLELADGARVSNLGNPNWHVWKAGTDPEGPIFSQLGGSGGGGRAGRITFDQTYWLWPLPPQGPLRVFVEWPAVDVSLSSAEVDAERLLEAAAGSKRFWPD